MNKYRANLVKGHIIVEDQDAKYLIDTGSPISFSAGQGFMFLGNVIQENRAADLNFVEEYLHTRLDAIIGMDILSYYTVEIDCCSKIITFSGDILESGYNIESFSSIPVVAISVLGSPLKAFLDTGAQVSYLNRDVLNLEYRPRMGTRVSDFYLGYGQFDTTLQEVETTVGNNMNFICRYGILPDNLERQLLSNEIEGILGNDFFMNFKVKLDFKSGYMTMSKLHKAEINNSLAESLATIGEQGVYCGQFSGIERGTFSNHPKMNKELKWDSNKTDFKTAAMRVKGLMVVERQHEIQKASFSMSYIALSRLKNDMVQNGILSTKEEYDIFDTKQKAAAYQFNELVWLGKSEKYWNSHLMHFLQPSTDKKIASKSQLVAAQAKHKKKVDEKNRLEGLIADHEKAIEKLKSEIRNSENSFKVSEEYLLSSRKRYLQYILDEIESEVEQVKYFIYSIFPLDYFPTDINQKVGRTFNSLSNPEMEILKSKIEPYRHTKRWSKYDKKIDELLVD